MKKLCKWACALVLAALLMGGLATAGFAAEQSSIDRILNQLGYADLGALTDAARGTAQGVAQGAQAGVNQVLGPPAGEKAGGEYVVIKARAGDTLYKLAKQYGTSVTSIASLNQLKNPNAIAAGQELLIYTTQKTQAAVAAAPARIHTVVKGDTLTSIAKRYNTTVQKLMTANQITNANKIQIGQKLVII